MNQVKFKKLYKNKAVFFDRDGVLNFDSGYLHKIEDFKWIDGAQETIKYLNDLNFLVIVITNQSGVSRGYYTEENIKKLHIWMNSELEKKNAVIDDFFYCTELPSKKNNLQSRRKPSPLMINEAIEKYAISRKKSFLIGDKKTDLEAAKNAKIKGYLFNESNLYKKTLEILKEY